MDIWILVIALLVIAIIFLIMSAFAKEEDYQGELNEVKKHSDAELNQVKRRLEELEEVVIGPVEAPAVDTVSAENVYYAEDEEPRQADSEMVVTEMTKTDWSQQVSERTREDIIRYYSQGYTLNEIAREVDLNMDAIQFVIDDYIENR